MTRIIVDDLSSNFIYGGGYWGTVSASHFYGGSTAWPYFARGNNSDTGVYGSLTFSFQGKYLFVVVPMMPMKLQCYSSFTQEPL
jgi:hypothetical protein